MKVKFKAIFDDMEYEEVVEIDENDICLCYGEINDNYIKMYIDSEYSNWLLRFEVGWEIQ